MDKLVPESVNCIFGITKYENNIKSIIDEYNFLSQNKKMYYFPFYPPEDKYLQVDMRKLVSRSLAASVYALMFTVTSGISEVYFLGMDHSYILYDDESQMRYYSNSVHQKDEFNRTFSDKSWYVEMLNNTCIILKNYEYFQSRLNLKIYNCSQGSFAKNLNYVSLENICSKF